MAETRDPAERGALLGALGSFHDPALVRASLDLLLSDDFSSLDVIISMTGELMNEEASREMLYAYLKDHDDVLTDRLPHEARGAMPVLGAALCDSAHRQDLEAFFKDRTVHYPGGARFLAQTLERVDLCIAQREALQPGLTRFLSRP